MILASLWIFFIGSIAAGGAIDDALARKPAWYVACGLVAGIVCALFVAVNSGLLLYEGSGVTLVGLVVAAAAWLVYEVLFDIRNLRRRNSPQAMATLITTVALGLLYVPALALGALHGLSLLV